MIVVQIVLHPMVDFFQQIIQSYYYYYYYQYSLSSMM